MYYNDPTAWQAIANVMREQKQKQQKKPQKKHSGVAIYKQTKHTGGTVIHINKAEWYYAQMMRAINEQPEIQKRQSQTKDESEIQSGAG